MQVKEHQQERAPFFIDALISTNYSLVKYREPVIACSSIVTEPQKWSKTTKSCKI